MKSVAPDTLRVVLETEDGPLRSSVVRALAPERIRVRKVQAPDGSESPDERPDAVILAATADVPGMLETARREGWVGRSTPVFALMDTPLPREQQLEWLRVGVWEFVRLPLDGELFALRLRNLLRARDAGPAPESSEPYRWNSLLRVADESVALALRFHRPLTVTALALDWDHAGPDDSRALLRRLADAAVERIRRSDLLGVSPDGCLLVLLPDSDAAGAGIFLDRLAEYLGDRLREWGVAGRLRTGAASLDHEQDLDGRRFLMAGESALASP